MVYAAQGRDPCGYEKGGALMDIEKLIETLRQHGVSCVRAYGRYCSICDDAATALSTLQAENEKLRAELKQVKAERDAAAEKTYP